MRALLEEALELEAKLARQTAEDEGGKGPMPAGWGQEPMPAGWGWGAWRLAHGRMQRSTQVVYARFATHRPPACLPCAAEARKRDAEDGEAQDETDKVRPGLAGAVQPWAP